ncbi:putative lipoprotein [Burkholderia thailandensis]|uniref:Lipoprotein n=1 Tax=Burkholderia thailandensis TaxID=57975 RepID=A0AAW9CXP4_BURTH|nr:putative lipoprotein [Burkholderia thailandensis]MDW9255374.1 putative lipoprotein [Burkholderia thailandensis]
MIDRSFREPLQCASVLIDACFGCLRAVGSAPPARTARPAGSGAGGDGRRTTEGAAGARPARPPCDSSEVDTRRAHSAPSGRRTLSRDAHRKIPACPARIGQNGIKSTPH